MPDEDVSMERRTTEPGAASSPHPPADRELKITGDHVNSPEMANSTQTNTHPSPSFNDPPSARPIHSPMPAPQVVALVREAMLNAREAHARAIEDEVINKVPAHGLTIDLSRKNLGEIPEEAVDFLIDVVRLALSHNKLSALPNRISECTSLRYLNLRGNHIKEFPVSLCDLQSLEILDLGRNYIRVLPLEIGKLSSLKVLSAKKNRIQTLPSCLGYMTSLQVLQLDDNPIIFPPKHVMHPQDTYLSKESNVGDTELGVAATAYIQRFLRENDFKSRMESLGEELMPLTQRSDSRETHFPRFTIMRPPTMFGSSKRSGTDFLNPRPAPPPPIASPTPSQSSGPRNHVVQTDDNPFHGNNASSPFLNRPAGGNAPYQENLSNRPRSYFGMSYSPTEAREAEKSTKQRLSDDDLEIEHTVDGSVGDESEIESIFSTGSLQSSNSSLGDMFATAVSEWARVLINDEELVFICSHALATVGLNRFRRNFARCLKTYGQNLKSEAYNEPQRQAATFVHQSAKRTASEIASLLTSNHIDESGVWYQEVVVVRSAQVNHWLESLGSGRMDQRADYDLDAMVEVEGAGLFDGSDSDESEDYDGSSLRALEEVKEFMTSAEAFGELRQELRRWLRLDSQNKDEETDKASPGVIDSQDGDMHEEPTRPIPQGPGQEPDSLNTSMNNPTHQDTIDTNGPQAIAYKDIGRGNVSVWAWWWLKAMDVLYPPARGYQRLPYLCSCGELVYLDLRELKPGGIERFWARLSAFIVRSGQSPPDGNPPAPPPQVYMRPSMPVIQADSGAAQPGIQQHQPLQLSQGGNTVPAVTPSLNPDPQFLLLCINTKNSTALAHVEVGSLNSDQYLFQEISKVYHKTRQSHQWGFSMILPTWLCDLYQRASKRLPRFRLLPDPANVFSLISRVYSTAQLYRVASGDFVRFQLVPVGMECCPTWFKAPEFPPESEVAARRYLYQPVPMDDVEIAYIPLAHLLKPGAHHDLFWLMTFPKKLSEELRRPAGTGQRVVGWGIRINEKLNWATVLLGILTGLIATSIAVIVYSVVTSDDSSAFGLGAFLAALLTLYVTYQYLSWQEDT